MYGRRALRGVKRCGVWGVIAALGAWGDPALALEAGDPNKVVTTQLQAVYARGQEKPWWFRLGMGLALAVGDHCSLGEEPPDCRSPGPTVGLWPVVAPETSLGLRSGALSWELTLGAGLGSLYMGTDGFSPYWQLMADAGIHWEGRALGPALGGYASHALAITRPLSSGQGTTTRGTPQLALRLDADTWRRQSGWSPPVVAGGLQVSFMDTSTDF